MARRKSAIESLKRGVVDGVELTVDYGYDAHSVTLSREEWKEVCSGKKMVIAGTGFHVDGRLAQDYWAFSTLGERSLHIYLGDAGWRGFADDDDDDVEDYETCFDGGEVYNGSIDDLIVDEGGPTP